MVLIATTLAQVGGFIADKEPNKGGGGGLKDPKPTAPGSLGTGINELLGYGAWVVTVICVIAVLACAGRMAMSHKSGGSGEHIMSLGWIMVAAILVGSCASLAQLLL
ncbi:hypothetical protein OG948_32860 [Embleya sp. NBC_00888]|uniref:hypothetical protein n=1 Tax=Embleya sp. NBC_00888 TaxID=2975960 RepID=UPI0038708B66|nr:hypothetical protein OG948_32860 [Embleya sp. NBC_00888]